MATNALLLLNSYRPGGNPQTSAEALIHLIHDQIPAIAAATVLTAAHVQQVVAVLKRHASLLGGGLVYAASFLERSLPYTIIQFSLPELIGFIVKLSLGGSLVGAVAFAYWLYQERQRRLAAAEAQRRSAEEAQRRLAAEARARALGDRNQHLIKHYPSQS